MLFFAILINAQVTCVKTPLSNVLLQGINNRICFEFTTNDFSGYLCILDNNDTIPIEPDGSINLIPFSLNPVKIVMKNKQTNISDSLVFEVLQLPAPDVYLRISENVIWSMNFCIPTLIL